ncbi:hypothetical protein EYF80_035874 [Liparis tanakae]|uniref:Uncharacterized protein n=1 Tax=Liparis tanakae TaxID=230148 RepID=A0A4Z2GK64_9TELE|nr:hypothetical protein EYF80_035874 [Liparis tanakae]
MREIRAWATLRSTEWIERVAGRTGVSQVCSGSHTAGQGRPGLRRSLRGVAPDGGLGISWQWRSQTVVQYALGAPQQTSARGRLLLIQGSSAENSFELEYSASCQREDFLTHNLLKPPDQGHGELPLPTARCHRERSVEERRSGERRGARQSISPWGESNTDTVVASLIPLFHLSLPSVALSFSSLAIY